MERQLATPPIQLAVEPNPRLRTYCPPLHRELELFLYDLIDISHKEVEIVSSLKKEG